MIIVYRPADGEEQHFDARTLRVSEVSIVARTIEQKWPAIQQGLADEDLDAMRGVAWVLAKRTTPSLRFGDFDPGVDELTTRMDKAEIENYVAGAVLVARQEPDVTEDRVRDLVESVVLAAALDTEHAQRTIDKALAEDPKGPSLAENEQSSDDSTPTSTSSETATLDYSPTSSTSHLGKSTTS
ncbi:hypothetical protein PUR59_01445 [Streptomyces sp. SP18ES09]|uniref:hypothetical protein n=1 Tax=Streptomyces sp. SP18ES09 TaxID=3002532 RepID=UPI002E762E17|nr:hypothetical protein [Streptomyces sp. SP18ES09]MEE1813705.1 hypothetical protein [Streptomyces sp. SP18ES09]